MKPLAFKYGKGKPATGWKGIQPKLSVNKPGDRFEREADEMATKVMQLPQQDTSIIAKSLGKVKPDVKNKGGQDQLMRKAAGSSNVAAPSGTQLGTSNGSPMPRGVRSFMENAFSRDFSAVRLHTDDVAAGMSRDMGAKAFTYGNDIYFNTGQFAPQTGEGKRLLAHELTHVVQQRESSTTPDLQRTIELRPPGRGEASAFGRVQELVDRLNAQSAAIQYRLEGHALLYDIMDEAAMTHFDRQMQTFIDRQQVVRMRLITSEGRGRPNQNAPFEPIFIDFFDAGYVDLEDLLATDSLSFQTNMLHILAERFATRDYNRRIGPAFSNAEFRRAHAAGLEAEAANFRAIFNDPSIRFSYDETVGRRFMVVFRSTAEGFQVFVLFRNADASIVQSEVRVRTRDGQWFSGAAFQRLRAAEGVVVQPKLFVNKPGDQQEKEADAIAEKVVQHALPKNVKKQVQKQPDVKGFAAPPATASALNNSKGSGAPLPESTRTYMENIFHTDLSAVRIHTGQYAVTMSQDIQAKAFTHGSDIYFNSGQFAPWSVDGKKLLTHELVHVVQQQGATNQGNTIQRIAMEATPELYFAGNNGIIDLRVSGPAGGDTKKTRKMLLSEVKVPDQKIEAFDDYSVKPIRKGKRPTDQATLWRKDKSKFHERVRKKILEKGKPASVREEDGVEYFFFKLKKAKHLYVIGTLEHILDAITIPAWNRKGERMDFQVDHKREWQLGGEHKIENFWLWQADANQSSGLLLNDEILGRITLLIKEAIDNNKIWQLPKGKNKEQFSKATADKLRKALEITVAKIVPGLGKEGKAKLKGKPEEHYHWFEIFEQGVPLDGLDTLKEEEIDRLRGSKTELRVMIGNILSTRKQRKLKVNNPEPVYDWIEGFDLKKVVKYDPNAKAGEEYAVIEGYFYRILEKKDIIKGAKRVIKIVKVPGVPFFGKVEGRLSDYTVSTFEMKLMSPIQTEEFFIDEDAEAVVLAGKVIPTLSFLQNADINILCRGNDVSIEKTFDTTFLKDKVPKPFNLLDGELTLFASLKNGLGVDGRLDFEIEKVGTGFIEGAGSNKGFVLRGGFDFEKGIFDESHIEVSYQKTPEDESGKFSFKGWAAKKASKENKAIKYARIEVSYENGVLTAKGEAETGLPGIQKGTIQVITGGPVTSVEADFIIGDRIPGVTGGNLHFLFMKMEDGSFQIMASTTIQTKFPGIPMVSLKGVYKSDGTFLFEGDAILKKGDRFAGTVHFGITNQEVDEKGQLTGKKGDKLLAFGSGEVFFRMNKWLGGKINATISPDARVVLGGELRPDPLIPITKDPYKVNKSLGSFSLPKFTLFGIPRVAEVYVTASGYITFYASLGPVYLKGAFLKFDQLDIEHPELTVITGGGSLDIPGEAGITLGAIIEAGVGILVVDVSLFLNGSISFIVRGNAGLAIQFEWSMNKGFNLKESMAYLKATSELVAMLTGGVKVKLDLLLTTITLYKKEWKLGEKRWPLGLDLNLNFPLAFGGEGGENIELPDANKIKHEEPKFEKDTVKQAVMDDPPDVSTAPGKEEALRRIRILPADATTDFNFYSGIFERYNYVKGLKKKYPTQDWNYLDAELPNLDAKDLQALKAKIFEVPALLGRSATETRLFVLNQFEEKHLYLRPYEMADLRKQIYEGGKKEEE